MSSAAQALVAKLHELPLKAEIRILNVCGGHERTITKAGLRSILPNSIRLIPGPGCPVCVCPEEDVYAAIRLAVEEKVTLVAFGDMLRVPVNVPKREARTLAQAKALGADVRAISSPTEAVAIAQADPHQPCVFFAAGFETTMAPVAAMLAEGVPDNLSVLLAGRLTWPAVKLLLDEEQRGFDALIAPGHVATVMGEREWRFVPEQYDVPAAISGFSAETVLSAIYSVVRQTLEGRCFLDNCYTQAVKPNGNPTARRFLRAVLQVVDANWRGIGVIPNSGFAISAAYAEHDARHRYPLQSEVARKRMGEMPPGCDCAQVLLGRIQPDQCRLYGVACQPRHPIGPCMVSDEGACHIWWNGGVREQGARMLRVREV